MVETCILFAECVFDLGGQEVESILETHLNATMQKRTRFVVILLGRIGEVASCTGTLNFASARSNSCKLSRPSAEVITHWFKHALVQAYLHVYMYLGPYIHVYLAQLLRSCICNVNESSWTPMSINVPWPSASADGKTNQVFH